MYSDFSHYEAGEPALVLAPHLEFPLFNGADIAIYHKWSNVSRHLAYVDIVGRDTIKRFEGGELVSTRTFTNPPRGKTVAAARCVLNRSHYFLEKFVTSGYREMATKLLADPAYKTVHLSFIATAALALGAPRIPGRVYSVESHNDEYKWFEDIRRSSPNPLTKLVAMNSEAWCKRFMLAHGRDALYYHVTKADHEGFLRHAPQHRGVVVPVGVDLDDQPFEAIPPGVRPVRLLFVGSLGVKMNHDALRAFADEFWPVISGGLPAGEVQVAVVGSNPTAEIRKLCDDHGWELHANVPEERLARLCRGATFSLLPFKYVTGAKLKLLKSLAFGLPFLGTAGMADQVDRQLDSCLASDDPIAWLRRIQEVRERGLSIESRQGLADYAARFGWPALAKQIVEALRTRAGVKASTPARG